MSDHEKKKTISACSMLVPADFRFEDLPPKLQSAVSMVSNQVMLCMEELRKREPCEVALQNGMIASMSQALRDSADQVDKAVEAFDIESVMRVALSSAANSMAIIMLSIYKASEVDLKDLLRPNGQDPDSN